MIDDVAESLSHRGIELGKFLADAITNDADEPEERDPGERHEAECQQHRVAP